MPTLEGEWRYLTSSTVPDLDNQQGTLISIASKSRGLLKADPGNPRKWKFTDGGYIIPVALRIDFFFEQASQSSFNAAADFIAANGMHMMDTRLQDEFSSTMMVFDGKPAAHKFNLQLWDQLEKRMNALTVRGLGAYIMFYADDKGKPKWAGQSATEQIFLRYAVARLAGYPILFWDTGIDIREYRNQSDIDWIGAQIRNLDPYDHPVSSRVGGGSGKFKMLGRTYDSRGDNRAYIEDMIEYFESTNRPIGMFDAWGENRSSRPKKEFKPSDIRRSMWKAVMAGGLATTYRGNDGFFHIKNVKSDLESEQWIRIVNPFIEDNLGSTFGRMVPDSLLVEYGYALADPARTKILLFLTGEKESI